MPPDQPQLDADVDEEIMPPGSPIVRINGDTILAADAVKGLAVDTDVVIKCRGIVKKTGLEHVGKAGKRKFVQIHVREIEVAKS